MKKFLISFVISLGIFSMGFYQIDKFFEPKENISLAEELTEENKITEEDGILEEENSITFALMGIDDGGLKAKRGVRSDTIMLVNTNFTTGEIKLLTVPRDTRVDVRGKKDKINHAHSYGGADMAMETLNNFLDLDVEYYVRVDFNGVKEIVNSVGGVKMDVPVNMRYDDPMASPKLHININKGDQVLDGDKSLQVLRFRHNNGQDFYPGGYSREEVQQMWMEAFAKSVLSPKTIIKLPEIITTGLASVDTNMPMSMILSSGLKANKLSTEKIVMETIPIKDQGLVNGVFYFMPDEEGSREIARKMFKENQFANK